MKGSEIKVGGLYTARISGKFVTVRVDKIREVEGWTGHTSSRAARRQTHYDITNLNTGRRTTFRSAAKFRSVAPNPKIAAGKAIPAAELNKLLESYKPDAEPLPDRDLTPPADDCPPDGWQGETAQIESAPVEGEQGADPTKNSDSITIGKTEEDEQRADPTPVVHTAGQMNTGSMKSEPGSAIAAAATHLPPSGIAARIAAVRDAEAPSGLTQQQQEILATAREVEAARGNGQRALVIGAGAGTGKTFTLKQLEQVLKGNGQYTAFNSSLVAESKAKFRYAACNTTHSLAFRAVGKQYAHRLNGARVRSYEIAARLGIHDFCVELPESIAPPEIMPDGTKRLQVRTLKASFLAGQVTQAIRRFCQSEDAEIGNAHFRRFAGLDEEDSYDNSNKVRDYLLPFARKAWADLSNPQGTMPFSHDVYVKLWELGRGEMRPVIAADYILLDEAQDTAPVMLSILRQQTHAMLVMVGDDNQQIYEWRGAVNAMAAFPGAPRKLLSQSFRFGQVIADVANAVLGTLEVPTDLVMSGNPAIPSRVCTVSEPRCYLYRTNAGAIARLMTAMEEGKRGHLIGGTSDVVAFCRAALDLQQKRPTTHPELGCFSNWAEVQEYSKEDEGADLRLMVKLIDTFKADKIIKALEDMPSEEVADLVLSTAHRSKGREWPSVKLGADFPTKNRMTDADRRLVYVAATRAQEELDISVCPTFTGGYDGLGEDAEWIPGIEITYTVPMPTEEDLAAYRASKAEKKAQEKEAVKVAATVARPVYEKGNTVSATYTKLRSGDWGIRATSEVKPGQVVEVTTKAGERRRETIGQIVWSGNGVWLCTKGNGGSEQRSNRPVCAACGKPGYLREDMEDGLMKHPNCCDM